MAKSAFLSQAASMMLIAGELDLSSYFVRKIHENQIMDESRSYELGPVASTPCGTQNNKASGKGTPTKKGASKDNTNGFPGYFCQICGNLQNPLLAKFRVHPRIRRKKRKKISVNSSSSDEEKRICKTQKHARKNPFVTCRCHFCGHTQKLVCYPGINLTNKQLHSSSGSIVHYGRLKGEGCINNAGKRRIQDNTDTPKSALSVLSRTSSSRKKHKSNNSPLAKLLSAKKKEATPSPNLRSFLLNS